MSAPGAKESVAFSGRGLHRGAAASVRIVVEEGPLRLRTSSAEARLDELVFDGAMRSTRAQTRDGRLCVHTVEHLFAALGALSLRDGIVVEIDGPEIPLVDGGARAFASGLLELHVDPSPPRLAVVRAGTIVVGESRYDVRPEGAVAVEVDVDFGDPRLERRARWDGDAKDFCARIASARTFGFEHELGELLARGLSAHVDPSSVVMVARDSILSSGAPFLADEPARHKLLDLVGDLYAHGGPFRGELRAFRPGHAATHEAVARGLAEGLFVFM